MPQRIPPARTTSRGPKRSTRYPSKGTSQVSSATNTENATWIEARPQWNLASIGFTNSVQPYCRFAIMAMQMMPTASCTHRYAAGFVPSPSWTIAPISSPLPPDHLGYRPQMQRQCELSRHCNPPHLDLNQHHPLRTLSVILLSPGSVYFPIAPNTFLS